MRPQNFVFTALASAVLAACGGGTGQACGIDHAFVDASHQYHLEAPSDPVERDDREHPRHAGTHRWRLHSGR